MGGKKDAGSRAASAANKFTQKGIDALMPFLDAGRDQLGALTQGASASGLSDRLSEIMGTGLFGDLRDERTRSAQGALAAGGLTRSGSAIQSAVDIPTELALQLEQLLTGRSGALAGQGLGAGGNIAGLFNRQGENVSSGIVTDQQAKSAGIGQAVQLAAGIFFSDERLKKNAVKVMQLGVLPVYEWDWVDQAQGTIIADCPRIGFMAGEVQQVFPQHVSKRGRWSVVNYMAVMGELQADLDAKIASEAAKAA